jgi:hypothetical protein
MGEIKELWMDVDVFSSTKASNPNESEEEEKSQLVSDSKKKVQTNDKDLYERFQNEGIKLGLFATGNKSEAIKAAVDAGIIRLDDTSSSDVVMDAVEFRYSVFCFYCF